MQGYPTTTAPRSTFHEFMNVELLTQYLPVRYGSATAKDEVDGLNPINVIT